MKLNNVSKELFPLIGILITLAVIANPMHILMPNNLETLAIILLIVFFLAFISLIWREKVLDERDEIHRLKAGRISFIVGSALLIIGITVQINDGSIDPWLLIALSGMVLSKIVSRIFSDKNH
ncbi:hypothetical protein KC573_04205 [candidate division WWE3 bacterium]|uniref:DUF2178 domain-containing protein n=1 Tax=candidate division WWE3 bacterium TaxID=2053526 RepID=A0A955RX69_UNCKA|nr:hypothetical protein [candidate division WWE3 bacterium]